MIQNCVGKTATGEDFFDRQEELRDLWSCLETDSVLLLAPRRVGKTSLLRRLEATGAERDTRVIYTTVESAASCGNSGREGSHRERDSVERIRGV